MRKVQVGEEVDLEVKIIRAKSDHFERKTRSKIASGILIFGGLALSVTFAVGLRDHSYTAVQNIWNGFGPVVGAIVGYYFHKSNAKT